MDKFIELVRGKQCLWNLCNSDCHNIIIIRNSWAEVEKNAVWKFFRKSESANAEILHDVCVLCLLDALEISYIVLMFSNIFLRSK